MGNGVTVGLSVFAFIVLSSVWAFYYWPRKKVADAAKAEKVAVMRGAGLEMIAEFNQQLAEVAPHIYHKRHVKMAPEIEYVKINGIFKPRRHELVLRISLASAGDSGTVARMINDIATDRIRETENPFHVRLEFAQGE